MYKLVKMVWENAYHEAGLCSIRNAVLLGRNAWEMRDCRISGNADCAWKIKTKDKSYEE